MTRQEYLDNLWEHYRIVSRLSEKNGCLVLRVRHAELGKDLVVRSFPKPIAAYEALCGIKAENLPEVYDAITMEDGMIVLEEYIDGITVAQALEVELYRYRNVMPLMVQICRAMSVLHRFGIVHRDIKPENIMLDKNNRVVLIDLNASRKISQTERDTVIMGTVGYASPEQLGIAQSDVRTDIYATGVLLNVMLTGKHPSEQLAKGYAGHIVRRCTRVNPDERYQSAEKLANAL